MVEKWRNTVYVGNFVGKLVCERKSSTVLLLQDFAQVKIMKLNNPLMEGVERRLRLSVVRESGGGEIMLSLPLPPFSGPIAL